MLLAYVNTCRPNQVVIHFDRALWDGAVDDSVTRGFFEALQEIQGIRAVTLMNDCACTTEPHKLADAKHDPYSSGVVAVSVVDVQKAPNVRWDFILVQIWRVLQSHIGLRVRVICGDPRLKYCEGGPVETLALGRAGVVHSPTTAARNRERDDDPWATKPRLVGASR